MERSQDEREAMGGRAFQQGETLSSQAVRWRGDQCAWERVERTDGDGLAQAGKGQSRQDCRRSPTG